MLTISLCAEILAVDVIDLTDEVAAIDHLAKAGFSPRSTAPVIDVIASLARDLRAEQADSLTSEFTNAG